MGADIRFPHLGIELQNVGQKIQIGSFSIAYYGIVIAFGMLCGYLMAAYQAKRMGQDKEMYLDLALWDIIFAVIGARIYYVIFSWDYYKGDLMQIFNIRGGGLAIYGGVIAGVATTFVFSKIRKVSFLQLVDTACAGLLTGQIIGRWGNFFNREAFGGYTDGLLAMQIKRNDVASYNITPELIKKIVNVDGTDYVQVHPTFLYESLWNIAVLVVILLVTKRVKYNGQLFLIYLAGYGLGRLWIEGLRTDQLLLFHTGIAVSQLLSAVVAFCAIAVMIYKAVSGRKKQES